MGLSQLILKPEWMEADINSEPSETFGALAEDAPERAPIPRLVVHNGSKSEVRNEWKADTTSLSVRQRQEATERSRLSYSTVSGALCLLWNSSALPVFITAFFWSGIPHLATKALK